ncbi:MAG: hypothetical protein PVI40_00265 [Chlamydiota bacterium]|jgi:hypothetical protein
MIISIVAITQVVVTCFLTGLIWFVQIVHYPLFKCISADNFIRYHQQHMRKTSYVVVPLMIGEAFCVFFLAFSFTKGSLLYFMALSGLILLALIWLSTFGLQVPKHLRLKLGHKEEIINTLITTNWIRTILWSLRSFVSVVILIKLITFKY